MSDISKRYKFMILTTLIALIIGLIAMVFIYKLVSMDFQIIILGIILFFIIILIIIFVLLDRMVMALLSTEEKVEKKAKKLTAGATETVEYRKELETTKEALKASENKYKSLVNNLRTTILTIDKTGRIMTINRAGIQLLGCKTEEEAKEANLFKDFGIPKEDCKSLINILRQKGFIDNFESILIRRNREKAIIRVSSQLIRDENDQIKHINSIIRDITTLKLAEAEKSALEAELFHAEKLASIGQLAAGVAHEINNPLTNISLLTTSIRRKTDDEAILTKLNKLKKQQNIAAKIVSDLLQFSRKMEPKFLRMNLSDNIAQALDQMVKEDEDLISVKNNTEGKELWVRGDPDLLRQVFINIFENAYDAMGESGSLTVSSRSLGLDHLEIHISDTGPGIPESILAKIFDPFYSTKQSEKGTGLGLSICHGIIKTHEGKIYAHNNEDKGASFIIQFPRWKDEVQDPDSG